MPNAFKNPYISVFIGWMELQVQFQYSGDVGRREGQAEVVGNE